MQSDVVALHPDGKALAVTRNYRTVQLWDLSNPAAPQLASELPYKGDTLSLAFSPDGRTLAAGLCTLMNRSLQGSFYCTKGRVALWDVVDMRAPRLLGNQPFEAHDAEVRNVTFSPDGQTLATVSCGERNAAFRCTQGEVRLWDVSFPYVPRPIGGAITGLASSTYGLAFTADGRALLTGCGRGACSQREMFLWPASAAAWIDSACAATGRNLTEEEWVQFLGDEPYHKTCDQWSTGE
jgi:WD40 repeat protein